MTVPPKMMAEINQDAAPLQARARHGVNAEPARARRPRFRIGGDDILSRAPAIVVKQLANAVTIRIEALPDMGKRIPMRRILRRKSHDIVADDLGRLRLLPGQRIVLIDAALFVAWQRRKPRRMPQPMDDGAARKIQGKAQAECKPLLDVAH